MILTFAKLQRMSRRTKPSAVKAWLKREGVSYIRDADGNPFTTLDALKNPPPRDMRCCSNCLHWHLADYIHCQCSGPWGGDIKGDPRCTFQSKFGKREGET